jgi:hypothetical protein
MRRLLLVGGCVGALAAPAGAGAAGGPVPAMQGPSVRVPGSAAGYVAVGIGGRTLVEQVLRPTGAIGRTLTIRGRYGVPGVAYDTSTTGLSADGRTLVLAQILDRFPVRRTRLAVLDARRLRVVRRITLAGYYTVDAIAPDGRSLYLIRYLRQDGTRYEVRAYDLAVHRLVRAPVVDPREPGEKMQGLPLTRAMTADGRFAYTLYQRPEGPPFIHALDTARGTAACIDLPSLAGDDLSGARLTPPTGARPLLVGVPGVAPLAVDVAARRARPASAVRTAPAAALAPGRGTARGDLVALGALAAAAALGTALATTARRRRRQRTAGHREMPA